MSHQFISIHNFNKTSVITALISGSYITLIPAKQLNVFDTKNDYSTCDTLTKNHKSHKRSALPCCQTHDSCPILTSEEYDCKIASSYKVVGDTCKDF